MEQASINEMKMKKISSSINVNIPVVFDKADGKEVFIASDTQILKYNYETGFLTDRFKVHDRKITKFEVMEHLVCLTKDNFLIQYDMNKKVAVKKIKVCESEEQEIINFKYSHFLNSFICLAKKGELIFVQNNFDSFEITKTDKTESLFNMFSFLEINSEGKVCMFSNKNKLFLYNLITYETKSIEFQKNLSSGIFLGDSKVVVGDVNGKLHFLSNLKEQKHLTAIKHWHSHRVTAIETDANFEYLYTAGEEGVIVVWNLKTEDKSFLPRLSSEITSISISPSNQTLAVTCKDQTVKFINLFNFTVVNEYASICLEKNLNQEVNSKADSNCIKQFNIKGSNYLLLFNKNSGKMQIFNMNNGKIMSNSSLMFKNFTSQTEKESINYRKLVNVEISKPDMNYLITYEEISDEADKNFLISYLKLWRVNNIAENFSIDLLYIAENPHNNEKVERISFNGSKFITCSEKCFKIWEVQSEMNDEKNKPDFKCVFAGSYREHKVSFAMMLQNSEVNDMNDNENIIHNENEVISLHGGKHLVQWNIQKREITRTFNLDNEDEKLQIKEDKDLIILYSPSQIIGFSLSAWDIIFRENFESFSILNDSVEIDAKGKVWFIIQSKEKKSEFLVYGVNTSQGKSSVEDCILIKKNNIRYINHWKNCGSLLIVNSNQEILISKKKTLLGKKTENREEEGNLQEDIKDFVY